MLVNKLHKLKSILSMQNEYDNELSLLQKYDGAKIEYK